MPIIFIPQIAGKKIIPMLFLHVPKCGGSSIEKSFLRAKCLIKLHDRLDNNGDEILRNKLIYKCPSQHFHYKILESFLDFNIFYDIFSMVRNPFSRLASEYRFMSGRIGVNQCIYPIDEWVNIVIDGYKNNQFILYNHIRPQVEFMVPGKTRIFRLENGVEPMLINIFSRLKKKYGFEINDFGIDRLSMFYENTTRKNVENLQTQEELFLRDNASMSKKIRDFYINDFKAFYPEDLL